MLDWFRSLFGASSDTQSKGLRKTKSMPTLTSRGTSRIAPSRGGSRHSKSTSSLKNETMMLEAQRLFVSMGLALTSTKNSKKGRRRMMIMMSLQEIVLITGTWT